MFIATRKHHMARNRIDARTHPVPLFDISRRDLIVGGGAMVAAFGLPMPLLADQPSPASTPAPHGDSQGENLMNVITATDGTKIYFKDWGTGQPVVFSHGWPLTADAWDSQMLFLGEKGYRVIAHDRRGHGRSSQSWNGNEMDTYADDLAKLIETLDLKNATLVGHSTGGGEVARYIGRHGSKRVSKAVLIASVPPLMLKTKNNPGGLPISVFDQIRASVVADRSQFFKDLSLPFYGYNRSGAKTSQGVRIRSGCRECKLRSRGRTTASRRSQKRINRGSEEVRRTDADPTRRRRPDRAARRLWPSPIQAHQGRDLESLSWGTARSLHDSCRPGQC